MPMPRRGLEKSLSERHSRGMAQARHGMCESNKAAPCKSNGKDTMETLSGTVWQGNGMNAAWDVGISLYWNGGFDSRRGQ
jgi:hypothetical protein